MRTLAALLLGLATCAAARAETRVHVAAAAEKKILIFRVGDDGKLVRQGEAAAGGEPGALATDPRRHYLFAALRAEGKLSADRIDAATGGLERFATCAVGRRPWWVLAVRLAER